MLPTSGLISYRDCSQYYKVILILCLNFHYKIEARILGTSLNMSNHIKIAQAMIRLSRFSVSLLDRGYLWSTFIPLTFNEVTDD